MTRRTRVVIYGSASALWALAVLGAIGVARWLELSTRDTVLLVLAVALAAVVGAFVPAVQLGLARWQESQPHDSSDQPERPQRRD